MTITPESAALSALQAANARILADVRGNEDSDRDALLAAEIVMRGARALVTWRAAILVALGDSKTKVAEALQTGHPSNLNRKFPNISSVAEQIKRAIIREESVTIDVDGFPFEFDGASVTLS